MQKIHVIDSHTGGEPTRLIVSGGPDLGDGPLADRRARLRDRFDDIRRAVVCEPRGSDVIVGAIRCVPHDPTCAFGIIYFNNVGVIGMCGHGTIGVVASLAYTGELGVGRHRIDTPVGVVEAELHGDGTVSVFNVPSYRHAKAVTIEVNGLGTVVGDVAWGGNWFFLVEGYPAPVDFARIRALSADAERIREALRAAGVTGADGAEIDHIELFAPTPTKGCDSRNFVLCPGLAYDRSPCGTGTSAKLACLAADGKLAPGQVWRQESIVGSVFETRYQPAGDRILPEIRGRAHVMAEATMILDPDDPFRWGISG